MGVEDRVRRDEAVQMEEREEIEELVDSGRGGRERKVLKSDRGANPVLLAEDDISLYRSEGPDIRDDKTVYSLSAP